LKALVVLKTLATAVSVAVLLGGTVGVNATTYTPMSLALPSVGSLGADSDYTVFMQEGVPEALRVQALRKLWRSHPVIATVDDLSDYGQEDMTVVAISDSQRQAISQVRESVVAGSAHAVESPSLPPIGSLDADSDYTVFMQEGVPEALRLQALSKLWRSHPVIAAGDDLTDYGDDYRAMTESEDRLAAMIVN